MRYLATVAGALVVVSIAWAVCVAYLVGAVGPGAAAVLVF